MRLIPVNSVVSGTVLARTVVNSSGVPLLRAGYPLDENLARRALTNGITALYIQDSYSDELIDDVVSPELRQKAVITLKNSFEELYRLSSCRTPKNGIKDSVNKITSIANEIVDDILKRRNVLINLVDIKTMDDYTYQHCVNICILSVILGIELHFTKKQLISLAIGALLHDFGKVFVPKEVLKKNGKLTEKEFELIKAHPQLGYDYLIKNTSLNPISYKVILEHHEKVNGSGYPNKLKGNQISQYSKIISICDVYDALTSDRHYRPAMPPNEAIEYIMGSCGTEFDLELVRSFINRIVPYPVGTVVKLSNGKIGVVKRINRQYVLRPVIDLLDDTGESVAGNSQTEIDLTDKVDLVITGTYTD